MTTRTELLELINNGENSGVEFKRDVIDNRALAKELVAFSNLSGGAVLLGVEDDGKVSGITRDKLEEWVMTACRDKIRPAIIPFFEIIRDIEPGKDVAVVRVPAASASIASGTTTGTPIISAWAPKAARQHRKS